MDVLKLTREDYLALCKLAGYRPHPSLVAFFEGNLSFEEAGHEVAEDLRAGRYRMTDDDPPPVR